MIIEIASEKDIPQLCRLLDSLFSQESEFSPDRKAQARGLAAIVNSPDIGDILVIRDSGNIIGMVNLLYTISTALGARVALLEDMVVSPDYRGKDAGSELIRYAVDYAEKQGCRRITLLTDHDNEGAHRFYGKHGFQRSSMTVFRMLMEEGE